MTTVAASTSYDARPRAAVHPDAAALRASPIFASAVPAALAALARDATRRQLSPGAVLLAEGSAASDVLVIVRGQLRAVRRADNGREVTVETFRAGDVVPDAALETAAGAAFCLVAGAPSLVLAIPRDVFRAHMRLNPEIALALAQTLARRIARQRELAVSLAITDVQGRVVRALRHLAERDGEPAAQGVLLRQRPTQQELANAIGACRETVSRVVSHLAKRGLLCPQGRGLFLSAKLLEN